MNTVDTQGPESMLTKSLYRLDHHRHPKEERQGKARRINASLSVDRL
jgi:hypothetical protein